MTTRIQALLIIGVALAAGCSHRQPGLRGDAVPLAAGSPLDEYRRTLQTLQQVQRENEQLMQELARAREDTAQLYERLALEQKLRADAQLALNALKASNQAPAATPQEAAGTLQTELERTKTELAAARNELKARREELMKIILDQQKWNKYVLDRIKAPDAMGAN